MAKHKARDALASILASDASDEAEEDPEDDDLPRRVFDLLGAGSSDGRLHGALLEQQREREEELETLKQEAAIALEKVFLEEEDEDEADSEVDVEVDVEAARQKAAAALEAALVEEEEAKPQIDLEAVRRKAAAALEAALLEEDVMPEIDLDSARHRAAIALEVAFLADSDPDSEGEPDAEEEAGDALRWRVFDLLGAASGDGRLRGALLEARPAGEEAMDQPKVDLAEAKQNAIGALNVALLGEEPKAKRKADPLAASKRMAIDALKAALLGEEDSKAKRRADPLAATKRMAITALMGALLGEESKEPDVDAPGLGDEAAGVPSAMPEDTPTDGPGQEVEGLKERAARALKATLFDRPAFQAERLGEEGGGARSEAPPAELRQRAAEALRAALSGEEGPDAPVATPEAPDAHERVLACEPGAETGAAPERAADAATDAPDAAALLGADVAALPGPPDAGADATERGAEEALGGSDSPEALAVTPAEPPQEKQTLMEAVVAEAPMKKTPPQVFDRDHFQESISKLEASMHRRNERRRRESHSLRRESGRTRRLRMPSLEARKFRAAAGADAGLGACGLTAALDRRHRTSSLPCLRGE